MAKRCICYLFGCNNGAHMVLRLSRRLARERMVPHIVSFCSLTHAAAWSMTRGGATTTDVQHAINEESAYRNLPHTG